MMTIAPIRSSDHAVSYFERSDHSDYYTRDEVSPSVWEGKAAEILGIQGQVVEPERFKRYLNGEISGVKLGTRRNSGENHHKPGFDLQFAPPKSVSIAALVGGDIRIINAHNQAVKDSLNQIEKKGAYLRIHTRDEYGEDNITHKATGNLLAAVFRHETSRKLDPQLHSHAIVLNVTQSDNLQWRSIESRHFYCLQKEIGLHYRQNLAANLNKLGYQIERQPDASFEIKGIPENVIKAFSQRRDEIDHALEKLGYTRQNAPAYIKENIAHSVRNKKIQIDSEKLFEEWRRIEKKNNFSCEQLVAEAKSNIQLELWNEDEKIRRYEILQKISKQTITSISERESVFSRAELINQINQKAVGYGISANSVEEYVHHLEKVGKLLGKRQIKVYENQFQKWHHVDAYTTPEAVHLENEMIGFIEYFKNKSKKEFSHKEIENIIHFANDESVAQGYDGWNLGQKTVMRGLLANNNQVSAIQGFAGTAKTSTVLKLVAQKFQEKGYQVVGMAPSASACESLKQGAELKTVRTVASHLIETNLHNNYIKKQLWLVDEASLLSTKDMTKLFKKAEVNKARLVLVGDVKQLGSVEAGAAFLQLQDQGLMTFKLDEIVRQENKQTLKAVYASIEAEAKTALDCLQRGGGEVIEVPGDGHQRAKQIVEFYLSLSTEEREKTLLIDPSIEGRDILSNLLRDGLKQRKELDVNGCEFTKLEKLDLTKVSRQDVLNYSKGQVIKFLREYKSKNIQKNSYWKIVSRDIQRSTLLLRDKSGRELIWNPTSSSWGKKVQAFLPVTSELAVGDKIMWTLNDRSRGLLNGMKAKVEHIDHLKGELRLLFTNGNIHTMSLIEQKNQHWTHDYVSTAHASQGMTSERVIYHAESFRRNLASQKAFYVAISRAKHEAIVYTENQSDLIAQLHENTGEKLNAKVYEYDLEMSV